MYEKQEFRNLALKWVHAFNDLVEEKRPVKCPVCGIGNLSLEAVEGNVNEVRIFCDEDPTHENYVLKPKAKTN